MSNDNFNIFNAPFFGSLNGETKIEVHNHYEGKEEQTKPEQQTGETQNQLQDQGDEGDSTNMSTTGDVTTTETEPEDELIYDDMPDQLDNNVIRNSYHGVQVDMKWLWRLINYYVVKDMKFTYECMSVYYFLQQVELLEDVDFTKFCSLMSQWYGSSPNFKKCGPSVKSHYSFMFTVQMDNWIKYVRKHKEDEGFKPTVNMCVRTIPQIKDLLSRFYKKYPNQK